MLKKLDDGLEFIENWILILTGIAVCVLIFISAMMRYILKTDFYGSEEIILFTAFWLYFTGSSIAAKKDTHINANMISMFVKNKRVVAVFDIIKCVLSLGICIVATYWCFNYVTWSIQMKAASNVFKLPLAIGQLPIFISFFFWTLYLIRDVIKSFSGLKNAENTNNMEGGDAV
ncbi:hypothetical protein IMSAG049_00001 [Clostridiales bacterium]|nr:hypothetical protein IMSAG049_00001 [Clostridiales bacterium]